jgi:hypothetical protein
VWANRAPPTDTEVPARGQSQISHTPRAARAGVPAEVATDERGFVNRPADTSCAGSMDTQPNSRDSAESSTASLNET